MKREVHAPLLACRDPRVSWQVKLAAVLVVVYAVSPIDLIPDFIPGCLSARSSAINRRRGNRMVPHRTPVIRSPAAALPARYDRGRPAG
ncbi:YkvA family protein [Desulfosarcina sp.]|uniref:YkvA family protein n=1 Tax=Desulfosarcina sp. TaxID=2027861 RepID=UPI0035669154